MRDEILNVKQQRFLFLIMVSSIIILNVLLFGADAVFSTIK